MLGLNEDPMNKMYKENEELKEKIKDLEKLVTDMNNEMEKVKKDMNQKCEEHRCQLEGLKDNICALSKTEREKDLEIFDARKKVVQIMKKMSDEHGEKFNVRIKKFGDLKEKPFMEACKKRFDVDKAAEEHAKLWLTWKENLKNPTWHPFKRELSKEVVDEEDEKLKNLREEWGEEVMAAVKTALEEMNEFNHPTGRDVVTELWDFERDRKVSLALGIGHMLVQYACYPRIRKKNVMRF